MNKSTRKQIISIIDDINDMTIATVRKDGYPQATTVSYVNDSLTIYFGTAFASQKAQNITQNNKVSLTINRAYNNWDEIEGLSISGLATQVLDPTEQQKISGLLIEKFPQITEYAPEDIEEVALFRIDLKFISLLDYHKGFGHTELIEL